MRKDKKRKKRVTKETEKTLPFRYTIRIVSIGPNVSANKGIKTPTGTALHLGT